MEDVATHVSNATALVTQRKFQLASVAGRLDQRLAMVRGVVGATAGVVAETSARIGAAAEAGSKVEVPPQLQEALAKCEQRRDEVAKKLVGFISIQAQCVFCDWL